MIQLKYKTRHKVVGSLAANLAWELKNISSSVELLNKDRIINAKSLIGLLQAHIMDYEDIIVYIEQEDDVPAVKELMDQFAIEV